MSIRSLVLILVSLFSSVLHAAPVTVSLWTTTGNGTAMWPTGNYSVPGLAITGTSRQDWGNSAVTGYLYLQAYGFSDLHGVSYPNALIGELNIMPVAGNADGVTLFDFDLGSWTGVNRGVETRIYNGDYSRILTQGTTTVGTLKGISTANVFSLNGLRIQFYSPIGSQNAIDNIRIEGGNPLGIAAVPAPAAGWLLVTGLLGIGGIARRRKVMQSI